MADNLITCPQCRVAIPLSEALSHQIREKSQRDLEQALAKQRAEFEADKKTLAEQVAKMEKEAIRKADEKRAVEIRDLQLQLQEQRKKTEEAQRAEIDIRRQKREIEEAKKELDLQVQRKLDQERKRVEEETAARLATDFRQKMLEAEKEKSDMLKTIDELKRKAEQGSQQTQGEVVELEMENLLKAQFPSDVIEPVAKGIRGADVVQRVNRNGAPCGTIIWEFKQTKQWSDGWIDKLKEDRRAARADIAVLVTTALPKGVTTFTQQNGVWITSQACLVSLAATLRWAMVQHALARSLAEGTQGKMKALYAYLSGPEFRQRVEAIFDASNLMREQLEREKRLYQKNWSEREKLIGRVGESLVSMHGDLQGLGATLEHIESIDGELEAPARPKAVLEQRPRPAEPSGAARASASDAVLEDDELF